MPQIFGWMVHVYPFEQKTEDIWSVDRQAHSSHGLISRRLREHIGVAHQKIQY